VHQIYLAMMATTETMSAVLMLAWTMVFKNIQTQNKWTITINFTTHTYI